MNETHVRVKTSAGKIPLLETHKISVGKYQALAALGSEDTVSRNLFDNKVATGRTRIYSSTRV